MSFHPAHSNELQIDLDGKVAWHFFLGQHRLLAGLKWIPAATQITSSPGGNIHVRILLPKPMPLIERIALQAILGSDRRREAYNYIRAKSRMPYPVLLFEKDSS